MFKRKKKEESKSLPPLKPLEYSPKVLIAWGEAIAGNGEIRNWLIQNGYQELGLFCYALRNKDDAREWLMDNGYAHLAAMINGAEGNPTAVEWLSQNGYSILAHMAMAGDGNRDAQEWLIQNDHREFAVIATKIRQVKDEIEFDNNDIHRISKE